MPSGLIRTWSLLVALSVPALAACSVSDARVTIVDGWSIGPESECEVPVACEAFVEVATQALASREPGHPAIAQTSVHEEGLYPCKRGGGISPIVRSGGAGIGPMVLFVLADGSRRAFGVGFPMGSKVPVDHGRGPEVAPWECSDSGPFPTEHPTEVAMRV